MKTKLALLFALLMLFTSAFALAASVLYPDSAENTIELDPNTMTGTTTVSLTVDRSQDSYVVVIPSSVIIDPVTQYGYGDITLKAGWELVSVNNLKVRLSGAENGIGTEYGSSSPMQNFKLKTEDGKVATYSLRASDFDAPFSSYNAVGRNTYYGTANLIYAQKGGDNNSDKTCNLTFYVKTMPNDPGVYTDTLTFSIITE